MEVSDCNHNNIKDGKIIKININSEENSDKSSNINLSDNNENNLKIKKKNS